MADLSVSTAETTGNAEAAASQLVPLVFAAENVATSEAPLVRLLSISVSEAVALSERFSAPFPSPISDGDSVVTGERFTVRIRGPLVSDATFVQDSIGVTLVPVQFTDDMFTALAPWLAFDASGDFAAYLRTLTAMYDPTMAIVADKGFADDPTFVPGWSELLDVTRCPTNFLPFLAQFNGTVIPAGSSEAQARNAVRLECGYKRGSPLSLTFAVKRFLQGTQSVVLLERTNAAGNPDAYHFVIVIRPEELLDLNGLTDAVNAAKPAGLQWTLVQTDAWTISQMELSQASLTALEAAFSTLTRLEQDQPG